MANFTEREARGLDAILRSLGAATYAVAIVRENGDLMISTAGSLGLDGAAEAFTVAHKARVAGGGVHISRTPLNIDGFKRGNG